jgi:ATP dependent DNA ligase domain
MPGGIDEYSATGLCQSEDFIRAQSSSANCLGPMISRRYHGHKGPLSERRALLRTVLKPSDHFAMSEVSDRTAAEMLKFVKSHGLEGVVAKRSDSVYQPGLSTGLWTKHRINLGQEFAKGHFAALRCLIFSNFAQSSTSLSRASFS